MAIKDTTKDNIKEDGAARYLKKRMIGQGGRGKVWLVENVNTRVLSVMKVYGNETEEAEREIEILRKFGGKGIPYLLDCVKEQGTTGIVMEYVEGKSLGCLLRERKIWNEEEAIALIMKVAGILAAFHRQVPMVIYGDLKPENIMVTPEGEVYLIDFGSVLYEGEKERRVFGTREYLPPSEEGVISAYRDTYGLGVILYEMLTGNVLSKGIMNKKADISHLSHECRRIMQKAVKIHETEAYVSGGEIYEDLKAHRDNLHKEKKGRKKTMFQKKNRKKEDYFISDLKRMVCTGYMKGICLVLMSLVLLGSLWKGIEVEGAGMGQRTEEEMVIEKVVVKNDAGNDDGTSKENKENGKAGQEAGKEKEKKEGEDGKESGKENGGKESKETEIPRDEYGRKLIVRK